jgi:lysozyme
VEEIMKLSPLGLAIIESFEELRTLAYLDQHGRWTIGWGHTGPDVHEGMTCTPEQADAWKLGDVSTAEVSVMISTACPVTQHQFDAMVSLIYNIGAFAFAGSTLRGRLHAGDIPGAADQFLVWNHVEGVPNAGLIKRRKLERALFLDE